MKLRKFEKVFALSAFVLCLALGSRSVKAADESGALLLDSTDGVNYKLPQPFDVGEKAEFYVPALPGDNFDVTIEIKGVADSKKSETFSIFFDKVTDDQTVPNVQTGQDDRSGLLNETVASGKKEKRTFSVASTGDRVTFSVLGNVQVTTLKVTKQAAKKAGKKPTVYTVGDSLVQTYSARYNPQTGWGQTLSEFFTSNVKFVNTAIGGRSTGNFIRQGRLNDTLLKICPGDPVLIEFGHNDANHGNADRFVSVENYKELLKIDYIKAIRDRGGIPVLVTLVNPNSYNEKTGKFTQNYDNYVAAMKAVAEETNTLLIDANKFMVEFGTNMNEKYGIGVTDGVFYLKALPDVFEGQYVGGVADGTHMQRYGALRVGDFIAKELSEANIPGVSSEYVPRVPVSRQPEVPKRLRAYEGTDAKNPERVTWDSAKNAEFYEVQAVMLNKSEYQDEEGVWCVPHGDFKTFCFTTTCHAAYKVVLKNTKYAYRVRAINDAGVSEWSEIFTSGMRLATDEEIAEKLEAAKAEAEVAKAEAVSGAEEKAVTENAELKNEKNDVNDEVNELDNATKTRLWFVLGALTVFGLFAIGYWIYSDKKREKQKHSDAE